jgi:hypothetical protein
LKKEGSNLSKSTEIKTGLQSIFFTEPKFESNDFDTRFNWVPFQYLGCV